MVELEGRRREILRMIIDDYILTAEPIGSEAVRGRHRLGVSSATVRNEMAALEELGYLQQPHPSAGRIPTDQAYRVYVDSMLEEEQVSSAERARIRRTLAVPELDRAVEQATRALAVATDCASVAAGPSPHQQVVRHLHLIPLTPHRALVVAVTDTEVFKGQMVEFQEATTAEECDRLSQEISRRITGRPLSDLTDRMLDKVIGEATLYQRVLDQVGRLLRDQILHPSARVHTEGTANILKQPEFRDVRRAQPVLSALEREDIVEELLRGGLGQKRVRVMIGAENRREEMRDCSVISAPYYVGEHAAGVLGIVGPTRMRYGKIIGLVRFLAESLGDALNQF
ncbi:MAG TPA: heat-inducible transcriptional repressor HrcA [bacterium]|nr:heat-inducible transcriptional repressor HrcA [bacterium]